MSVSAAWSSLSCLSQAFIGLFFLLWVVVGIEKPVLWGLVPVLMLPTLVFFERKREEREREGERKEEREERERDHLSDSPNTSLRTIPRPSK